MPAGKRSSESFGDRGATVATRRKQSDIIGLGFHDHMFRGQKTTVNAFFKKVWLNSTHCDTTEMDAGFEDSQELQQELQEDVSTLPTAYLPPRPAFTATPLHTQNIPLTPQISK
jgi:hypothetical protein